jgi:hypothetical protein
VAPCPSVKGLGLGVRMSQHGSKLVHECLPVGPRGGHCGFFYALLKCASEQHAPTESAPRAAAQYWRCREAALALAGHAALVALPCAVRAFIKRSRCLPPPCLRVASASVICQIEHKP